MSVNIEGSSMNTVRYRGKIAWWWYSIVILCVVTALYLTFQGLVWLVVGKNPDAMIFLVMAIVFLLSDLGMIDSCIRNYVDFDSDSLRVTFSFMKEEIPYSKISLVKETNNPLASLAASLDRLLIKYGYDEIMMAIKDKEAFLEELQMRNPSILIERKPK